MGWPSPLYLMTWNHACPSLLNHRQHFQVIFPINLLIIIILNPKRLLLHSETITITTGDSPVPCSSLQIGLHRKMALLVSKSNFQNRFSVQISPPTKIWGKSTWEHSVLANLNALHVFHWLIFPFLDDFFLFVQSSAHILAYPWTVPADSTTFAISELY